MLGFRALFIPISRRDGMMQGVNVEQTVNLAQYSGLPVIASGGVTNLDDVRNLKGKPGILGAITGRAIYEGTTQPT